MSGSRSRTRDARASGVGRARPPPPAALRRLGGLRQTGRASAGASAAVTEVLGLLGCGLLGRRSRSSGRGLHPPARAPPARAPRLPQQVPAAAGCLTGAPRAPQHGLLDPGPRASPPPGSAAARPQTRRAPQPPAETPRAGRRPLWVFSASMLVLGGSVTERSPSVAAAVRRADAQGRRTPSALSAAYGRDGCAASSP